MVTNDAGAIAQRTERDELTIAYRLAALFLMELAILRGDAERYDARTDADEDRWRSVGRAFGEAFVTYDELRWTLGTKWAIRQRAREVHPPGAPTKWLGPNDCGTASHSVIEAVADLLGERLRATLFFGRRSPLEHEPQSESERWSIASRSEWWTSRGIKSRSDARELVEAEWMSQPALAAAALVRLQFEGIDFGELRVQLNRERIAASARLNGGTSRSDADAIDNAAGGTRHRDGCALTDDHWTVLRELARPPKGTCRTRAQVAAGGKIRNLETIGRLLQELTQAGLVHRPFGVRKGYALTDAGIERVRDADTTPPQVGR